MYLKIKSIGILIGLLVALIGYSGDHDSRSSSIAKDYGLPSAADVILYKNGFIIGYDKKYRQALWVCYILTEQLVKDRKAKRKNRFRADPQITEFPVKPSDYFHTGYDRGHLVPAADMAFSVKTMSESFLMTNISPQLPGCNRGIWKRLEIQVRKIAKKEKAILIITGPIFSHEEMYFKTMGKTNIPIPVAFYKVILDLTPPIKAIGFIVPNQTSRKRIKSFATEIKKVEALTGLEFFSVFTGKEKEFLKSNLYLEIWMEELK